MKYHYRMVNGVIDLEHRRIWKKHHGQDIPEGCEIHHIDGNRLNNSIENLECLDHRTHTRLHKGWKFANGEWWKCCPSCNTLKRISEYHIRASGGIPSVCKICENERSLAYNRVHSEQTKTNWRRYYEEHKEQLKARSLERYRRSKERAEGY